MTYWWLKDYPPVSEKCRPIPDGGGTHRVCYTNVLVYTYSRMTFPSSSSDLHRERQIELVAIKHPFTTCTFPAGIFCSLVSSVHKEACEPHLETRRLNPLKHYYMKTHVCINNPPHDSLYQFDRTTTDLYVPWLNVSGGMTRPRLVPLVSKAARTAILRMLRQPAPTCLQYFSRMTAPTLLLSLKPSLWH